MPAAWNVDRADLLIERDLGAVHLPRGENTGCRVLKQQVGFVIAVDVLQSDKNLKVRRFWQPPVNPAIERRLRERWKLLPDARIGSGAAAPQNP